MTKKRLIGLDILRALAIFLVIGTHFLNFHSSHFFQEGLRTPRWIIVVFIRYIVILCVPLFLLLTGYLLNKRKPTRTHYASIIGVLFSWIVITLASTFISRIIYGDGGITLARSLLYILDFNFGYTWYVEMYLCLFLVLPYINILLDNISKKQFAALIVIMAVLTSLSGVGQSFIITGIWFDGFPDQFNGIYCITYYLIGAYISRYKPRPNMAACAGIAVFTVACETAINWYYSSAEYAWQIFREYSALPHVIVSTSVFLIIYRIEKLPCVLALPIKEVSVCSFEMYLMSYMTDKIFYSSDFVAFCAKIPSIGYLADNTLWFAAVANFAFLYICARLLRLILVPISNAARRFLSGETHED